MIKKYSCSRQSDKFGHCLNKETDVNVKLCTSIGAPPHMTMATREERVKNGEAIHSDNARLKRKLAKKQARIKQFSGFQNEHSRI